MNFQNAIKTCYKKYAKFEGRASRSEFWYFFLFFYLVVGLIIFFIYLTDTWQAIFVILGFSIFSLLPYLGVAVRRLHDVNQPGWWILIALITSIIARVPGLELVGIITLILNIIILVICALEGQKKDNRFGKNIYKKIKKRK